MPRTTRMPAALSVLTIGGVSTVSAVFATLVGTQVTTAGVVTATKFDAYWLQDPRGDDDAHTSDAIYVHTGRNGAKPAVGQTVSVTGTVDEFRPART